MTYRPPLCVKEVAPLQSWGNLSKIGFGCRLATTHPSLLHHTLYRNISFSKMKLTRSEREHVNNTCNHPTPHSCTTPFAHFAHIIWLPPPPFSVVKWWSGVELLQLFILIQYVNLKQYLRFKYWKNIFWYMKWWNDGAINIFMKKWNKYVHERTFSCEMMEWWWSSYSFFPF